MPKVVSEGRRVINNVQRVSTLFLTKTIFSFLLAIVAIIRKGEYPIQPSQLVLIDYLVIGIPSFFLALEPNSKLVKGKFLWNILKAALPGALVVMISSLIIFAFEDALEMTHCRISLVVVTATVVSLTVLFRVSAPFNKMRRILFFIMVSAFFFGYLCTALL
jgi:cation-transporting P-type ATPase E